MSGVHVRLLKLAAIVLLVGCEYGVSKEDLEKAKSEIIQAERDFAEMAREQSIAAAFAEFADSAGVIRRGNKIIQGKEAIGEFYDTDAWRESQLEWTPSFVDVAASADLGYTYGNSTYSWRDSLGNLHQHSGVFHTVWKKQKDGTWRFVWD